MNERLGVVLVVSVLGCTDRTASPSDGAPRPFGAPPPSPSTARAEAAAGVDYSARKRVKHEVEIEQIAVALEIPVGLPRDERTGDWNVSKAELSSVPKVVLSTIEASRVETLERAQYHGTLAARTKTWVRGEERPDGYRLTNAEPDRTHIEAITYLRSGDVFVRCKASQLADDPIPNHARARAMLEAICDSLTLR